MNNSPTINTTAYQYDFKELNIIISGLYVILGIAISFFNLVVILVYMSANLKVRRKAANILLCNLAFVDLFQGLVTNGITIMRRMTAFGPLEYIAMHTIYQFSMTLGLHTTVLVSVERYLMIVKEWFHRSHVTAGRVRLMICITWLSAVIFIPFRLAHWMSPTSGVDWELYTLYYIAISDAVVCAVIAIVSYCYTSSYRVTKRYIARSYKHRSGQVINEIAKEELRHIYHSKRLRITKLFICIFFAFIISHLPAFLTGIYHISVASTSYSPILQQVLDLDSFLYFTGSLFNPIVCLFYKDDYKKHLRIMLKHLKFKHPHRKVKKDEALVDLTPIVQVEVSAKQLTGEDKRQDGTTLL